MTTVMTLILIGGQVLTMLTSDEACRIAEAQAAAGTPIPVITDEGGITFATQASCACADIEGEALWAAGK